MAERALAHIEKVEWIKPIDDADNIELIGILGWVCIAKKGEFNVGDTAIYIEIDSKCPSTDKRFSFLESKHYKIKTMKLSKFHVISQGLALPIELFPELKEKGIGTDVTKELGITYSSEEDAVRKTDKVDSDKKYKKMASRKPKLFANPIVRRIMKYAIGRKIMFVLFGRKKDNPKNFPEWIIKTDETRIENAPFYLQSTEKWIKTEKLDGTSCTFAVDRLKKGKDKFDFIACSRNVRQADREQSCYHDSNVYWELADKYDIENILTKFAIKNKYNRVVIQGEGVGKTIQGNPYKFPDRKLFVFNLIIEGKRVGTIEMSKFCKEHNLTSVPIIDTNYTLPKTMKEMKLEADGYSLINPEAKREGIVYRTLDGSKSFKNVSREYLLKHNG